MLQPVDSRSDSFILGRNQGKTGEQVTSDTGFFGRSAALFAILAASVLSPTVTFAKDLVFGPVTFQRGTGAPTVFNLSFSAPEPSRGFIFKVYNGGPEDTTYERVSSSTITLNGVQILGPSNFDQNVTYLEVPVALQAQNTLNVEVRGKPGGAVVITAYPCVVINAPTAGQVFGATNPITVFGQLYFAATSISVNGLPATVGADTFSVTGIPLTQGSNTLAATANCGGGFSGSDSVQVVLDSVAPIVSIEHPPEGLVTRRDVAPLYTATDNLDPKPTVSVYPPPPYVAEGVYQMTVTATDWAGNQAQSTRSFTIDSTPPFISGLTPAPESATANALAAITASFSDSLSGIEAASIRLQIDGTDVTSMAAISELGVSYHPSTRLADGHHQVVLTIRDRAGNEATASGSFTVDTNPPAITIVAPAEGATASTATVDLVGSVADATATVTVNGAGVLLAGNNFSVAGLPLAPGQNTIHIEAHDALGNNSSVELHVTYVQPMPTASPTANLSVAPGSISSGSPATLSWTSTDAVTCAFDNEAGAVACNGSRTVYPTISTIYTFQATGPGGTATAQADVTVTGGGGPLPPGFSPLTATPASIPLGASSTLSLNTPPMGFCSIDNGIGSVPCYGSITVSPLVTTTYTLSVDSFFGPMTATATVTVTAPLPVVSITATPLALPPGGSSTLSWSTTNAESCSISGVGTVPFSGTMTVTPTATTEYQITASGQGGTTTSKVLVTVKYPAPTVTISASPAEIMLGGSVTLNWSSTNATACSIDQGIGVIAASGTMTVSPSATTTYTISAAGLGGTIMANIRVTVKYLPPTLDFSISPTEIIPGESAVLSWSSTNASYCTINPGVGVVATSGTMTISPGAVGTYTYSIAAYGPGGTVVTAQAQVFVKTPAPTVTLVASPEKVLQGAGTTLIWSSTNAYSCSIEGIGYVGCNGTRSMIPTDSTTYRLVATGYGGTAIVQATVTVEFPPVTVSMTASPTTIKDGETATLTWSSMNAAVCTLNPGLGVIPCSGSQTLVPADTTTYTFSATGPGGTETTQSTVTVDFSSVKLSIVATPSTIHLGETATLSWNASGFARGLMNQGIGSVMPVGTKVVQPTSTTEYVLTAAGTAGASQASTLITVLGNVQPQPEGSFGAKYQDLIPQDATTTAYDAKRFSLVTGSVNNRNDQSIAGVSVTILSHPEYGTVITNDEGQFTLPVEGGGILTVSYRKSGYLATHRQVDVPWNGIAIVAAITMISEDAAVTRVKFNGDAGTVIVHQSTVVADEYGSRSATIVFTGDNKAYAKVDGEEIQLSTIDVRATEFDTPNSMPAKLPPTSAYTYCSELAVDGAKDVRFDKPVTVYVDNFLGFNVGEIVPAGYYDRNKGVWMASDNGVVVRLLDTNGDGIVDALDSVGDGQPHDTNVAGLTDPNIFIPGEIYWQVKIGHFSPWDFNWSFRLRLGEIKPNPAGNPVPDQQKRCDGIDKNGSLCERRSRILHEDIPVAGTDMILHYASNRVPGYKTTVTIPASGQTVPASLTKIIVRMEVAGRVFETTLPPSPNQKAEFSWDGMDYLGIPVVGTSTARISIGFGYIPVYYSAIGVSYRAWAESGYRSTIIPSREELIEWKYDSLSLQRDGSAQIAEGWTLTTYHFLSSSDPNRLHKGDGTIIANDANVITTVAGNGLEGFSGDGGPATLATLYSPESVSIDSAGNMYIADTRNHRIRKVNTSGIITTVAGNGSGGFSGDGRLATQARLFYPTAVIVDSADNLYISDYENHRIRKVDPGGIITTIAGNGIDLWDGSGGFSGDGGPATQAQLGYPASISMDSAGNIYFADIGNYRIRKVDTSGIITTVAGNGSWGFSGDGGLATQARMTHSWGLVVSNAGNIYINDYYNRRIRKVDASGIITTIAGNGISGFGGDGGPATQAQLRSPGALAIDSVGNIYISDRDRIRKVDTSGIITTVAGNGSWGFSGDGGPATQAQLRAGGLAVDSAGNIFIADSTALGNRVRKVSRPGSMVQSGISGDIFFADENGLGYFMSSTGLHKSTIDLTTRETLMIFGHNAADQLVSATDRFGSQTTIQRDSIGKPVSITSPDGIVTRLATDSANRLTQAFYPDGSYYSFGYSSDGLMTDVYDRRGSLFVHDYNADGRIIGVFDPEGGTWNYSRTIDSAGNVFSNVMTGESNVIAYQDKSTSTGAYTSVKTEPTGEVTTTTNTAEGLTETTSSSCGMNGKRQYNLDTEYMFKYISAATTTTPANLRLATTYLRTYQDNNNDKVPDLIMDLVSKNGRSWTTTNNSETGIVTSTTPFGRTATAQYDPATLLTQQVTVPGLSPTAFNYDTRGRLINATTGSRTTTVAYDTNGYYDHIITPDNKTVDYTYDPMGRLRSLQRSDGSVIQYDYDLNGNMIVLMNPMSVANTFGYTASNQRNIWAAPLSGGYQYSYDKERKLKTIMFPSGKVISNTYTNGLLTSTSTPEDVTSYSYSCGSNLGTAMRNDESMSFTYDGSLLTSDIRVGSLGKTIGYTYNNDFALSSMTYAGETVNLGYDADGLLASADGYTISRNTENGMALSVSGNGMKQSRNISGYGEMDGSAWVAGGASPYQWNVSRDVAGRILQRQEVIDSETITWGYAYDTLGRLIEVKKNTALVESYSYDANGNRLSEMNSLRGIMSRSFSHSVEDHVLTAGSDSYYYDVDGFFKSKATVEGATSYEYSSRGELLRAGLPDGTIVTYVHDPMGRRIAKQVNGATVEKYLWKDRTTLFAVYDGNDNLLQRYMYADARMPVSMMSDGATYFLLTDQVGTLRAVADTTGAIVKRIDYDSFGNIIADTNPSFSVPFGFAGGLHDRDTGLVRFGYRDYSPELGRFTAKDPIDFAGGDANLYAYTMSDPVNMVDPSGLYGSDVHYDMTLKWALAAGIEPRIAVKIASANQGVDESYLSVPENPINWLFGTGFHFQSEGYAITGLSQALDQGSVEQFGKFLHILQDSFAHAGYGFPFGHARKGTRPDDYCAGSARDTEMRDLTNMWLQEFERVLGKGFHPSLMSR